MRVLFDLNVILDVVLNRQPWANEAAQLWNAHTTGRIDGYIAAIELTNLFYVVRNQKDATAARLAVRCCIATFNIIAVDRTVLSAADSQSGSDFEDNVCIACADAANIDVIVTRDASGFAHSTIPVEAPAALWTRLNQSNVSQK